MACNLCEKLKNKTKSINNIMTDQNDMVTITNGSQTRKVARIFFEAHCTKTWRIVDDPEPIETETEPIEPETEPIETETESEPKTKKKKS